MAYINKCTCEIASDINSKDDPIWDYIPDEYAELQLKLYKHFMYIDTAKSNFGSPYPKYQDYAIFNDKNTREENMESALDYIKVKSLDVDDPEIGGIKSYVIKSVMGSEDKQFIVAHTQPLNVYNLDIIIYDPRNWFTDLKKEWFAMSRWNFSVKDRVYHFRCTVETMQGKIEYIPNYMLWKMEKASELEERISEYFEKVRDSMIAKAARK